MNSSSASPSSSNSSISPPISPAASIQAAPTLEQLTQYFVAAKQSLGAAWYISRADELVTSSRALVEEIAVLNAKNTFARRAVGEKVDTLHKIKDSIVDAADAVATEFGATIEKLDSANDRLQKTLEVLRKIVVDSSLRREADNQVEGQERDAAAEDVEARPSDNAQKTLYHFIDETSHTNLQSSLRGLIDTYNDARNPLDSTLQNFSLSLQTMTSTLSTGNEDDSTQDKATLYDDPAYSPTISDLFHSIELHATELATLLQSLVSHYDLCVSALKHTEGGGEAIYQIASSTLLPVRTPATDDKDLRRAETPLDEDMASLLQVLSTDAGELEDVLTDIRDRNAEQEDSYSHLLSHAQAHRHTSAKLQTSLSYLHQQQTVHLPSHTHALRTLQQTWERVQAQFETQTDELEELTLFYEGFRDGYAKLLLELQRRKDAEEHIHRVREKACRELRKLAQTEELRRQDFVEETGKFLPVGLWHDRQNEVYEDLEAISSLDYRD